MNKSRRDFIKSIAIVGAGLSMSVPVIVKADSRMFDLSGISPEIDSGINIVDEVYRRLFEDMEKAVIDGTSELTGTPTGLL